MDNQAFLGRMANGVILVPQVNQGVLEMMDYQEESGLLVSQVIQDKMGSLETLVNKVEMDSKGKEDSLEYQVSLEKMDR